MGHVGFHFFTSVKHGKLFDLTKSRQSCAPHGSCPSVSSTGFSALAAPCALAAVSLPARSPHREGRLRRVDSHGGSSHAASHHHPFCSQALCGTGRPRGCPERAPQVLVNLAARALLQTLNMSFPAFKAIHTSERCVHGSAGGFTTGRVPCA